MQSYPASAAVRDCQEQSKRRSSSWASPKLFCWWEQRTTWAALDPASACESCSGNPWLHLIFLLVPLCLIYLLTTVHREPLHIWNAHASRVPQGKAFYARVKATWISYSSANACSWMHKDQAPEDNFEEQMQMGKYQICLEVVHYLRGKSHSKSSFALSCAKHTWIINRAGSTEASSAAPLQVTSKQEKGETPFINGDVFRARSAFSAWAAQGTFAY